MTKRMTKEELQDMYNDSWIYIMLLSTLVILTESLKNYTFVFTTKITYSVFLIPIILLITNFITKKYGFKRSFLGIIVSTLSLVAFVAVMYFAIGINFTFSAVSGQVVGYLICQLVNLFIYCFLLNNTSSPYILLLINYLFALIAFYLAYTVMQADLVIGKDFWSGYFITLVIQLAELTVITSFDKSIKRGLYSKK